MTDQADCPVANCSRACDCTRRVLGHTFRPMTEDDWAGFAGAEPGTLICWTDDCALLLEPSGDVIEASEEGEACWRREPR